MVKKVKTNLPDLHRIESGYEVSAYYLPNMETRESVSVIITLASQDKTIDSFSVPVEDGFDAWVHPSMYSAEFRKLLAEAVEMARR